MIRKKYNKIIAVLVATFVIGSTFVGCTNKSANAEVATTTVSVEQSKSATILGKVKAIDGSKITISLGEEVTTTNSNTSTGQGQNSAPSEKPAGEGNTQNSNSEPPEKPAGDQTGSSQGNGDNSGTPPEMPQGGGAPGMGNSSTTTFKTSGEEKTIEIKNEGIISVTKGGKTIAGTLADITIGEILSVSYESTGNVSGVTVKSNNTSYTGGSQTGSITLVGAYSANGETKTSTNEKISAPNTNQNGVLATNSGNITIKGATISKTGDSTSEEECNFYGVNSGVVAAGASNITISDSTINTSSEGSNAIFATGDASLINVSNVTINTTKDSSRGLDATYNGTIIAKNTKVNTQGTHCAGLATDRGEGTVHFTDGTVKTAGIDSPAIYSTGNITAKDSTLTATGSEAVVVEGKNSVTLNNCTISGEKKNGVMLYQSMSGDSGIGTSYFNMTDGTLTSVEGALFFITNTDSEINLKGATLKNSSGVLLNVAATSRWGKQGSNGGNVILNADSQTLEGAITCDNISTVTLNLKNNSSLTSTINTAKTSKSVTVALDKTSTWTVTGTSYITVLTDEDTELSNIKDNGNTIYYDASNSANSWLGGKTITLSGGGSLKPLQ